MQRLEPTRQAERSVQGQATDPGPHRPPRFAATKNDENRPRIADGRPLGQVRLGPLHRRRPNGGRSPRSIPSRRLLLRHRRSGGTPPCGGQRPSGLARRSRGRLSVTIAAPGRARHKRANASSRCSRCTANWPSRSRQRRWHSRLTSTISSSDRAGPASCRARGEDLSATPPSSIWRWPRPRCYGACNPSLNRTT